ncbi:MAG: ABC transporter permease [Candidatus Enteromonas sp.]|nr:ABC transporter permease [Candidatus Enteromonas sp.]
MRNPFKQPLFHVVRRRDISIWKSLAYRFGAILVGLLLACLLLGLTTGNNPFSVIPLLFEGIFSTERKFWIFVHTASLLLIVGLALLPAFKMKFWNLGGNGQILISCLATLICMKYLGAAGWPDPAIIAVMIPVALLAGMIWAVIPAIFKALFNTNESLFTLMMNYIAAGIVAIFINAVDGTGSGTLSIIDHGQIPGIELPFSNMGPQYYPLTLIISLIILGIMFAYLRFHKHGYELAVVGESQNTAKYIGINVKKVIIRTVLLSGAVCGVVGLLLGGAINHTMTVESANNMGFTAIMITWLARFNPFAMVGTATLVAFVTRGMAQVQKAFGITNSAIGSISIGIIYFTVIAVEFLISYRIVFNHHYKQEKNKQLPQGKEDK